jgi:hypothetical protein
VDQTATLLNSDFLQSSRPTVLTGRLVGWSLGRVSDRGDDQGLGPYYSSDLRRQPNPATHVSLSLTDEVGGRVDLACGPSLRTGAEDKNGQLKVNLLYRRTTPFTGLQSPLVPQWGMPVLAKGRTQRHHDAADTPVPQPTEPLVPQWGMPVLAKGRTQRHHDAAEHDT